KLPLHHSTPGRFARSALLLVGSTPRRGTNVHVLIHLSARSDSIILLSCYLAVVCGVSLRHIALLFASLILIPLTRSSIKRWIENIGSYLPTPEAILRQLLAIAPAIDIQRKFRAASRLLCPLSRASHSSGP